MASFSVSIGLPVFNGAHLLERALQSLLGQSHGDFELIISDNASEDATRDICEAMAKRDKRIRYSRNARNLGVMPNFHLVRRLATAPYFMWASHDDTWSPNYVSLLAQRLDENSSAVLSAGRTEYVTEAGEPDPLPSSHAPPTAAVGTQLLVAQLLAEHSTSWFYGMYRREALARLVPELDRFPIWGGDLLFLFTCALDHDIVGDESAIIYKMNNRASRYRPTTPRQRTSWQVAFITQLARVFMKSRLSFQRKWELLPTIQQYVRQRVVWTSLRTTARQLAYTAAAISRGAD